MNLSLIGIIGPMLLNFFLLFNRKKKWAQSVYKWYLVLGLLIASLLILAYSDIKLLDGREKLAIWGLTTPFIFSLLNNLFKIISIQIHNRDLHLWLRGSNDIDDSKLSGGKHVKGSDRILSIILLFTVIFLPLFILVFK